MSESVEKITFDEKVLRALGAAEPAELIKALYALFSDITAMDKEQVEAAWHTTCAVKAAADSSGQNCFTAELQDALLNQMGVLVCASAGRHHDQVMGHRYREDTNALLKRFRGLTGRFRYDLLF